MSKRIKLSDFNHDDKNFNKHTDSGMDLLDLSVEKVGIIESITVSSDDKVISGNARKEIISKRFNESEPIVVETDGTRPVILKRTDIKSETKEFFEAAILANTVSKHNINLDLEKIQEVAVEEYQIDVEELGVDLPGFDVDNETEQKDLSDDLKETFEVIISCKDEKHQEQVYNKMIADGFEVRVLTL